LRRFVRAKEFWALTVRKFPIAIFLGMVAAGVFPGTPLAAGNSAQSIEKTSGICQSQTARVEREMGIPAHLLGAISLAETGRWDAGKEASFAWPWTVMAEGRGRYFDSKAEALAEIEGLRKRGITNIDVGCMQINLRYHGEAFADLEEALDPAANVAYAGEFLKDLHGETGSWTTAAGYYHSATPEHGNAYRERVVALWERNGGSGAEPAAGTPGRKTTMASLAARRPSVSINMELIAKLNARRRLARAETRQMDFEARRKQDLAFWRESGGDMRKMNLHAIKRRAQAEAERQREIGNMGKSRKESFAQRRKDQLRRWRLSLKNG
jgi:hypothetical protein